MPRTKNGGFWLDDSGLAPYREKTEKDVKGHCVSKKRNTVRKENSKGEKKKK